MEKCIECAAAFFLENDEWTKKNAGKQVVHIVMMRIESERQSFFFLLLLSSRFRNRRLEMS